MERQRKNTYAYIQNKEYVHWSVTLKELNAFEMDVIYNLVRGFRKC